MTDFQNQTFNYQTRSCKERPDFNSFQSGLNVRPQNFIRCNAPNERQDNQPKLQELFNLKKEVIEKRNTPPVYIKADLKNQKLNQLGKFDVILIDPPWEEQFKRGNKVNFEEPLTPWSLEELKKLQIDQISDVPSFVFLWCGSGDHLEDGRELFNHWGIRRCEDIVWAKTNYKNLPKIKNEDFSQLNRIKEHCLVGIKGTVKRGSDGHFIHANVDTDVIISEEEPMASTRKPAEIQDIIERFCLGRKRLELFARPHNRRPGWLSVGIEIDETNFDKEEWNSWFDGNLLYPDVQDHHGGRQLGTTESIENIRPKSPNRDNQISNRN